MVLLLPHALRDQGRGEEVNRQYAKVFGTLIPTDQMEYVTRRECDACHREFLENEEVAIVHLVIEMYRPYEIHPNCFAILWSKHQEAQKKFEAKEAEATKKGGKS